MSSIDNVKRAMDWRHPNDRQSCGNCTKVKVDLTPGALPTFRCTPGGFITKRHAICDEYEPEEPRQ